MYNKNKYHYYIYIFFFPSNRNLIYIFFLNIDYKIFQSNFLILSFIILILHHSPLFILIQIHPYHFHYPHYPRYIGGGGGRITSRPPGKILKLRQFQEKKKNNIQKDTRKLFVQNNATKITENFCKINLT